MNENLVTGFVLSIEFYWLNIREQTDERVTSDETRYWTEGEREREERERERKEREMRILYALPVKTYHQIHMLNVPAIHESS